MSFWKSVSNVFGLSQKKIDHEAAYLSQKESSPEPWASFEVVGFEADGRIKVKFNWNTEFIRRITALGFQAETEEDIVQLFFYTSSMRPTGFASDPEDGMVQSSTHPQLSQTSNEIRV